MVYLCRAKQLDAKMKGITCKLFAHNQHPSMPLLAPRSGAADVLTQQLTFVLLLCNLVTRCSIRPHNTLVSFV